MKRKLSVGIDVDGVLRNFSGQFAKFAKEFHGITLKESDYETWGYPNVRDEQGRKLVSAVFANPKVGQYIYEGADVLPNAMTGYKMFIDHPGIDPYVVTSQKKGYEPFTENWLSKQGFTEHTETFFERNKLNAPVQVIVDDKPDHIKKYLQNQRAAVLINQPYNRNINFDQSVDRADDLIDAYKLIINKYGKYL